MPSRWIRALILVLSCSPTCLAWGREGHRLVAAIAEQKINRKAQSEVAQLLAPGETLQSIASWADEVRPNRRETSTWHYINIPITAARGGLSQYCAPTGCVPRIIPEMMKRLQDRSLPMAERAEALKFLVHFVGDLHQPLHCGDRGDRGGNDVATVFRDRPGNLHSVWDTALLESMLAGDPGIKEKLGRKPGFFAALGMRGGGPDDWAWEAQALSRDVAYAHLPAGSPALLDNEYATKAYPVIRKQIRRAGVRLARLLNEALGQ